MANVNNSKLISNDKQQTGNQNPRKIVIITSVDDDNEKILSRLIPSSVKTFVVDSNDMNIIDAYQVNQKNYKRSLCQSEQETSVNVTKNINAKKRKADLTCVVCGGQAVGYNFAQITCESCKAFFRRNALYPIEKTKCNNSKNNLNEIRCNIRYDVKHKCQRCRLLKCFQTGMSKDYILTPEEKQLKKDRLEENRRMRFAPVDTIIKSESVIQSPTTNQNYEPIIRFPSRLSSSLSEVDWSCLRQVQNAYLSASQSTPSASSVICLELAPDIMSAFMNTIDLQNFVAVKLINFLREIPEFDQLDERDRLILVKYNLTLLFLLRHTLSFDSAREIFYDVDSADAVSPTEEAFAQHCKSLFILCYGYEFNRIVMSILRALVNIVNKDQIIVQLIMLITIFSKGLSADDDQGSILNDEQRVFYAQSKYTDLLFRYLMQQSSFEVVAIKMARITEQLLKIQKVSRDFHQYIKSKVDFNQVNPLMKSLLHLT